MVQVVPDARSQVLPGCQEHIVVVEFMRRKLLGGQAHASMRAPLNPVHRLSRSVLLRAFIRLAFVFGEVAEAQRFLICIELLIRRAQDGPIVFVHDSIFTSKVDATGES